MVAVPLLPSLAAVIVADPTATPATRPLLFTVATCALLLDHVTRRPVSVVPAASLTTAANCWVAPTPILADAGLTATEATGTVVIVIAAVAVLPSLVAVIAADPTVTAVTSPLALTVATVGALLDHVTERSGSTMPVESWAVAVSCTVAPNRIAETAGLSVTEATGTRMMVTVLVSATVAAGGSVAITR